MLGQGSARPTMEAVQLGQAVDELRGVVLRNCQVIGGEVLEETVGASARSSGYSVRAVGSFQEMIDCLNLEAGSAIASFFPGLDFGLQDSEHQRELLYPKLVKLLRNLPPITPDNPVYFVRLLTIEHEARLDRPVVLERLANQPVPDFNRLERRPVDSGAWSELTKFIETCGTAYVSRISYGKALTMFIQFSDMPARSEDRLQLLRDRFDPRNEGGIFFADSPQIYCRVVSIGGLEPDNEGIFRSLHALSEYVGAFRASRTIGPIYYDVTAYPAASTDNELLEAGLAKLEDKVGELRACVVDLSHSISVLRDMQARLSSRRDTDAEFRYFIIRSVLPSALRRRIDRLLEMYQDIYQKVLIGCGIPHLKNLEREKDSLGRALAELPGRLYSLASCQMERDAPRCSFFSTPALHGGLFGLRAYCRYVIFVVMPLDALEQSPPIETIRFNVKVRKAVRGRYHWETVFRNVGYGTHRTLPDDLFDGNLYSFRITDVTTLEPSCCSIGFGQRLTPVRGRFSVKLFGSNDFQAICDLQALSSQSMGLLSSTRSSLAPLAPGGPTRSERSRRVVHVRETLPTVYSASNV